MRLKILLFPTALFIAMFGVIGYIIPEVERLFALMAQESSQAQQLLTLQSRVDNSVQLVGALKQHESDQRLVGHYLPVNRDSDVVVDAVNFLAGQSGVTVTAISVKPPLPTAATATESSSATTTTAGTPTASAPAEVIPPVVKEQLSTSVGLVGLYPNIKDFLARLEHANRLVNFTKVNVKEVIAQGQDNKGSVSGLLSLNADIDFLVMSPVKNPKNALIDASKDVFASGTLDTKAVASLNDFMAKAGISVPDIAVSGSGKSNPFIQ